MDTPKSRTRRSTQHVPTPKMSERKKNLFTPSSKHSQQADNRSSQVDIEMNILDGMMPLDFESAIHVQSRLKSCLRPRVKKIPSNVTTILKTSDRIPLSVLGNSNMVVDKQISPRSKKSTKKLINDSDDSPKRLEKTPSPLLRKDSSGEDLGDLLKDTLHLRSHKTCRSRPTSDDNISDEEVAQIMSRSTHKRPQTKSHSSPNSKSPESKQLRLVDNSPVTTPKSDNTKPKDPNSNTDSPSTNKNYIKSIEEFSIPAKSFYSSTQNKSPIVSPRSTRPRLSLPVVNLNKSKSASTRKPQKSKSKNDLRLAKNVSHGIRRPKFKPTQQTIDTILQSLKGDKFKKLLENRMFKKKADEVNQILKKTANNIERSSRPLNSDGENQQTTTNNEDDDLFSDDSDIDEQQKKHGLLPTEQYDNEPWPAVRQEEPEEPDEEDDEEEEEDTAKPRKFFKSRKKGVKNAFTINNFRGTVKKGRVTLLPMPTDKSRRSGHSKSKLDFANEQAAVKDIIEWLDDDPPVASPIPTNIEDESATMIHEDEYMEFRKRIPYKTTDPAVIEQQQLLLDFLISYDICNERNFEIFIVDPDNHKNEAAEIVDSLITVKPSKDNDTNVSSSSRDDDDLLSEMSEPLGLNFTDSQEANSFRQRLPYNTNDPVVAEQQKTLLEFLIKNQICNEENFQIFIAEPEKNRDKASKILQNYMITSNIDGQNEPKSILQNHIDNCMSIDPFSVAAEVPSSYVAETTFETSNTTLESMISDDDNTTPWQLSPAIPLQQQQQQQPSYNEHNPEDTENRSNNLNSPKFYPIFYSGKVKPLTSPSTRKKSNKSFVSGFGSNQYQIDAGQKSFGATQCSECGLVYTVHEPEEEKLHSIYHRSLNILKFKGWIDEDVVMHLPEWGPGGRIFRLTHNIHPKRMERVVDILNIIDKELGIVSDMVPTPFVAYMAVRRNEIVGFALVQPIKSANRYVCINGTDYTTEETFEAKLGVSRIWVSPLNRRQRIATKLMEALRRFTFRGIELSPSEIAFSSPTQDGKHFAQKIAKRKDFLVYQSF